MRKQIMTTEAPAAPLESNQWVDLERAARVEISSEDSAHPIEAVLLPGSDTFWRAAHPGLQKIRLYFDEPLRLRRVRLTFGELEVQRTQEFSLRWLPEGNGVVAGTCAAAVQLQSSWHDEGDQDYTFDVDRVTALEVEIIPNLSGGEARDVDGSSDRLIQGDEGSRTDYLTGRSGPTLIGEQDRRILSPLAELFVGSPSPCPSAQKNCKA